MGIAFFLPTRAKSMTTSKIPAWALKVQVAYRQKFKVGDIVKVCRPPSLKRALGVVVDSTDDRGDAEQTVNQLEKAQAAYSVWFKDGPSSWYSEAEMTLVKRA
jgi:hypothetical protein